jgi:hypothetical protein
MRTPAIGGKIETEPLSATPGKKRHRRTIAEIQHLFEVVQAILAEQTGRIPIRHLWYRVVMTVTAAVKNTQREYDKFIDLMTTWRYEGKIPYSAFIDDARGYIGSEGWDTPRDFLNDMPDIWRKNFWKDRDDHVEIWTEKNAIAHILLEGADPWHVRVLPTRGFNSISTMWDAARGIIGKQKQGKMVYVYQFADWDPSGVEIDRSNVKRLCDHFGVNSDLLTYERIAVTREQVRELGLPSIPTKDNSQSGHGLGFEGDSVEVDAVTRDVLIDLVRECLSRHIPEDELERLQAEEDATREKMARAFRRIRL